ncbi:MAG TPA: winged helix-turn-helix domain-containing protein [Blastocatellia bacterium]|nr:winged helix-turn-helix domain-containing protein [Blastocatellia bacterium]
MNQPANHFYEFGPFRLNPVEHLLLRDGEIVPLSPKPFELLLLLVRNHGHLLEKEEMMRAVWPDTIVEEGNLTRYISTLRQALGEKGNGQRYILTAPKRGYRFAAGAREVWDECADQVKPAQRIQGVRSIAALPFKPLVVDARDESFELGLADTLITKLCGIGQVIMKPTSAVRKYTELDQDAVAAGRELMVDAVLDGSIQRSGEIIRVTVRLVSVKDGAPLWAGQFDEKFTDIFRVQDSISERVAEILTVELIGLKLS